MPFYQHFSLKRVVLCFCALPDTHLETKFDSAPSGSSAEAFGDTEFTGGVVNDEEKTDHCVSYHIFCF